MRDSLYLWHQPHPRRLICSGLEFRDLLPELRRSDALLLLRHEYANAEYDRRSGFDFVMGDDLGTLADDDIYSYGDFCWVDVRGGASLSQLSDEGIADLTFFAHTRRPRRDIRVPELNNEFLWWSHDGAWYVSLYYTNWQAVGDLLVRLLTQLVPEPEAKAHVDLISRADAAWWCRQGSLAPCEATENMDKLINAYRPPR